MLGYERSKVRRTFITFFWYRCGGWNRSGRSLRRKIFRVGHFEQNKFWPMTPFEVLKTSCWKWNFKFRGVAAGSAAGLGTPSEPKIITQLFWAKNQNLLWTQNELEALENWKYNGKVGSRCQRPRRPKPVPKPEKRTRSKSKPAERKINSARL